MKQDKDTKLVVNYRIKVALVWVVWVGMMGWLVWSLGREVAAGNKAKPAETVLQQVDVEKVEELRQRLRGR